MKAMMVYMTAKNRKEALELGKALVEKRLAACINILGPMESFYRWKGKLCHDREVAFLAKTRSTLMGRLMKEVKTRHSYQCPCIVAWPITRGHPAYLTWLKRETGRP